MPDYRYFVTYSGVKLPLKLVNPLEEAELGNRNTFIRAAFDERDRIILVEKMVYGEIELAHQYAYDESGALKTAHVTMDGETTVLNFATQKP